MPDLRQTLVFSVKAKDVDKLIKDLEKLDVEFEQVEEGAEKAGKATGRFGKSVSKIGAFVKRHIVGIAIGAFTAVAGAVAKAAAEAAKFEQNLAEVSTLVDTSKVSMDGLRSGLLSIAKAVPESLGTLTKALYQTVSAGIDAGKALGVVEQAARAAKAGATDTKTAVDGLTTVLNAFGLKTEQVGEVSDAFFTAVKDGKTTFGELASAIGGVAPLASQLGVEYDELLAATAALTKGGLATGEAMTAIQQIMVAVVNQSPESIRKAKELGIEFNTTALQSKKLSGFLKDVGEKAKGNKEDLGALFGRVQGLQGALALTGNAAKDFAQSQQNMADRAGATSEAYRKMRATLLETWELVKKRLTVAFVEMGGTVLPMLQRGLDATARFLRIFQSDAESALQMLKDLGASREIIIKYQLVVEIEQAKDALKDLRTEIRKMLDGLSMDITDQFVKAIDDAQGRIGRIRFNVIDELGKQLLEDVKSGNFEEAFTRIEKRVAELSEIDTVDARKQIVALLDMQTQLAKIIGLRERETVITEKEVELVEDMRRHIEEMARAKTFIGPVLPPGFEEQAKRQREADKKTEEARKIAAAARAREEAAEAQKRAEAQRKELAKQLENAQKFVAALNKTVEARKFLKGLAEETRDIGAQMLENQEVIDRLLAEEIVLAKDFTAEGKEQLALAQQLRKELESQRNERVRELADYKKASAAIDEILSGAEDIGVALLEGLDPDAIQAAMATIIRQMQEDIQRAPAEGVDAMKAMYAGALDEIRVLMTAQFPSMAKAINLMVQSVLKGMAPGAKKEIDSVIDTFRKALSAASRDFDLGGSAKDFGKQVDQAFKDAVEQVKAMAKEAGLTDEELQDILSTLEQIRQAAITAAGAFSRFAAEAGAMADIVDEVANLAGALGLVDEKGQGAIKSFAGLINSAGELGGAISAINAATTTLGTLSGVGAAIGAAAGIIGGIGGLFGGSSGPSERERLRAQSIEIQQLQRTTAELVDLQRSLQDNARRITASIDDLIRSNQQIGANITPALAEEGLRILNEFQAGRQPQPFDLPPEVKDLFRDLLTAEADVAGAGSAEEAEEAQAEVNRIRALLIPELEKLGISFGDLRRMFDAATGEFTGELRPVALSPDDVRGLVNRLFDAGAISQELRDNLIGQIDKAVESGLDFQGMQNVLNGIVNDWLVPLIEAWGGALGEFPNTIKGALGEFEFMASLLGDANKAIQGFYDALTSSEDGPALVDPDSVLGGYLQQLIDAPDQAARQAIFDEIARLISEGEFDFGGLTPSQVNAILAPFQRISDPSASGGDTRFADAFAAAEQAARDFARFIDSDDTQGAFDAFISSLQRGADALPEGMQNFLKGFDFNPLLIATEEGQKRLLEIIKAFGDDLIHPTNMIQDALGLTEEEFRQLIETLSGFLIPELAPPEDAVDVLGKALRNLGLELDVLGIDVTEALRRFIEAVLSGSEELDADLADILTKAQALDLTSDAGRKRLQTLIESLTRGIIAGSFGTDEGAAEDILRVLQDMLSRSEEDDGFSRSVQIARTITEIQANEVITLLNEASYWLKTIHGFLASTFGQTPFQTFIGMPQQIMNPQSMAMGSMAPIVDVDFDIAIHTEQSVDAVMARLESEVRRRLYDAFER